ncbi:hypothetical protein E4T49_03644 [Aureobasidium sp. EXF-10728]|nr:hypothetical protein E4T49_03644 [Aureobasidium sp. EXF-10728]
MENNIRTPRLPPEILHSILHLLEGHYRTLLSAALVCKEWFDPATDALWTEPPPFALAAVPTKRRQFYANKVCALYFRDVEQSKFHSQYKNLKFPRLKDIGLDAVHLRKNQKLHLAQYIGPRLESFSYEGGHPCEDALERLETECPRLDDLCLMEPLELVVNAEKFKKFLTNRTSLKNIELGIGWEYSLPTAVLAHVLTLDHLDRLVLVPFLRPRMAREVFAAPNQFKNLRILHIRLHSESVGMLAAAAACVDTLFLEVQDPEHDVLQALKPMKNVRHLEIEYHNLGGGIALSEDCIKSLGSLQELEIFLIRTWTKGRAYFHNIKAPWLGDEQFSDMMSNLPKLKSLAFQVVCNITLRSITSLSKTHPELYCCDLYGIFDLDDWAGSGGPPLFPDLRRLAMDAPNLRGRTRATNTSLQTKVARIVDIIQRHVPMLEQLCFHDFERNVLADQVLEHYAASIGGHYNQNQAATFRCWDWMEENHKEIKADPNTKHENDLELMRRVGLADIFEMYEAHGSLM